MRYSCSAMYGSTSLKNWYRSVGTAAACFSTCARIISSATTAEQQVATISSSIAFSTAVAWACVASLQRVLRIKLRGWAITIRCTSEATSGLLGPGVGAVARGFVAIGTTGFGGVALAPSLFPVPFPVPCSLFPSSSESSLIPQ